MKSSEATTRFRLPEETHIGVNEDEVSVDMYSTNHYSSTACGVGTMSEQNKYEANQATVF